MIVLVAGANGFLGRRLIERLSRNGCEVFAISRSNIPEYLQNLPQIHWLRGDILKGNIDFKNLPYLDAVVHLAGATLGAGTNELMFLGANEQTTVLLCQALADRTSRFIYASSQAVYGNACNLAVKENFPLKSDSSAYACSKLNSENWLRWFQKRHGGVYLALRLCGFIEGGGIIDYLVDKGVSGQPIMLFANGMVRRDYLPVEKAIDLIISTLNYRGKDEFLPVNVGSGQAISAYELATLICTELRSSSVIHLIDSSPPQGDFVFNIDLARKLFDFRPGSLVEAVLAYAKLCKKKWGEHEKN